MGNDVTVVKRDGSIEPIDLDKVHKMVNKRLKIPMVVNKRSLNLASSVAIVLAEIIRQNKLL